MTKDLLAQIQLVLTVDCYHDGRIGFGCDGAVTGAVPQEALGLVGALQDTVNQFARANGFGEMFDCSKARNAQ